MKPAYDLQVTVVCPRCGSDLEPGPDGMVHCDCGLDAYAGYLQEAAYLDARLDWLRERVSEGAGPPDPATAQAYGVWTVAGSAAPRVVHKTSGQTWLVSIGAGLLVLAALVFVAVAWDVIGAWGQIGSLLALTITLAVASVLLRRRTHGTAEALAVVAISMGLISAVAAPALGALPRAWNDGSNLYHVMVFALAALWGVGLGNRFGLQAWIWIGWLLTPFVVGLALIQLTDLFASDELLLTLSALVFLGVGLASLLLTRGQQRWPLMCAGAIDLAIAAVMTVVALNYDPPSGAVLILAAALLATVLLQKPLVGWPLLGFWLALLAGYLPQLPAATALVGLAGAALLFVVARTSIPLAVTSAATMWSVYFVLSQAQSPSLLAGIAGLALLGFALMPGAAPVAWLGAPLAWAAFLLEMPEPAFFEVPTLVLAVLLLAAGLIARRSGTTNSGVVFGPAVSVALIPSSLLCWWDVWTTPSLLRFVIVMVVGVPLLVVGVRWHKLGLVVPASIAVSIAATAQIFATLNLLPRWMALAVAGSVLILIGARLEWVRQRGRDTEQWLQSLK